ncbi:unnamed protein product [Withania somnifera]
MGSVAEKELDIIMMQEETDQERKNIEAQIVIPESLKTPKAVNKWKKWLEVGIHAFIVLASQSVATILSKLYYDKGGNSTWLLSLTETIGFPILLIPMILWPNINGTRKSEEGNIDSKSPSVMAKLSIYVFLGFLLGGGCVLYSIGILYLPASTFSLISSSQLAFNVLFSLFTRQETITPLIANSIRYNPTNHQTKCHYAIGFVSTLIASAGVGLLFSITDLMFRKILKKNTLREIMDVIICQSFFATCLILIGFFMSKEWRNLNTEMLTFELGKLSHVMILIWLSVCWQLYTYSLLGLIMKVSAVFANVITTLGTPLIPLMSVIIFNDKTSGVKAISIILAIWGFSSYAYQQYLDELKHKAQVLKMCNVASQGFPGTETG